MSFFISDAFAEQQSASPAYIESALRHAIATSGSNSVNQATTAVQDQGNSGWVFPLCIFLFYAIGIFCRVKRDKEEKQQEEQTNTPIKNTKYYGETRIKAEEEFLIHAQELSNRGYRFVSKEWVASPRSLGVYIFPVLLVGVFGLGLILILILLLTPNKPGFLHATYQLVELPMELTIEGKTCQQCAENVKEAAKICRFCGYSFVDSSTIVGKS